MHLSRFNQVAIKRNVIGVEKCYESFISPQVLYTDEDEKGNFALGKEKSLHESREKRNPGKLRESRIRLSTNGSIKAPLNVGHM